MSSGSNAVFLSYASQDAEAARRIAEALRSAGIEVWFDQAELRGGDAWDRQIRKQIHDCALFIPVISATTQGRLEGYFRREWRLAVDRSHDMAESKPFLVPVVIDETTERAAEVPDAFRAVQWSRLPDGQPPLSFAERIERLVSPSSSALPTSEVTPPARLAPPISGSRRRNRAPVLVGLAVALLGVTYFALDKLVFSNRPALNARLSSTHVAAKKSASDVNIPERSIAVLPFVDMSEKHDQGYFADGMAEEILNLLVKIPELRVIGRTSSFQFRDKTEDLRAVGTTLGAAYVVEGSIRRSGDHIRVTAQLIDTRDGTHRWSQTYDREASDALGVQDEITTSLVRALQLEVASSGLLEERAVPTNADVYDTYLRGLHAFNRFDQSGMEQAVAHYRHALTLDPHFVPAAEQLARTLCDQPSWGFVTPMIGYEQARTAANAALKLDSNSAVAHAVLGCVHIWYDWDWSAALEQVETALAVSPNDPFVLVTAANARMAVGKWSESLSLCQAGLSTDPFLATLHQNCALAYMALGRFDEAAQAMRRVLEISPTYGQAHHDLGVALMLAGNPSDALAEIQKETPEGGRSAGLVLAYAALHRDREADAELARLEAEHGMDMAMSIADAYAYRGRSDRAFGWLNRAYAQKDIFLWTITGDPLVKNLRADPRYRSFLRKMNLQQ